MSNQTIEWLNTKTLIGFTELRGSAWHWRKGSDNHYPQAIPVIDVQKRLFDWEPVKHETYFMPQAVSGEEMRDGLGWVETGEFVYARSDNHEKICATTGTHNAHSYKQWLIENVSEIIGGELQIGSAGLLKNYGQAWVQIELEETQMANGVQFRPTLLASTSLDGSLAGTYKPVNTIVVCDNTMAAAHAEKGPAYKLKQTSKREFKADLAREAVGIQLQKQAEAFTAEVDRMLGTEVNDDQFFAIMDHLVPVPDEDGRTKTKAENKRGKLIGMYHTDPRVSLWKNTVWGVVQLMNTYNTHEAQIKGGNRMESNMSSILKGTFFDKDKLVTDALVGAGVW